MAGKKGSGRRQWMSADSALWHTCRVASDLAARRVPQLRQTTLFPLREREIAFASGTVLVDSFHAAGDGSYRTSSTVMVGTGLFGLALGAATMAGSAAGNASRRAQAVAAATPAWRPVLRGTVVITSQGFYLVDETGKYDWGWESVELMQVVGFTSLVLQGHSSTGQVMWRISSDWAELMFVLWAMARHPAHPQLVDQSWIPAGWAAWATAQGYPPEIPPHIALGAE